jgi:histidinol-phosphate aminotransferase
MAGNDESPAGGRLDRLVRDLYRSGGYVFAAKAGDITRRHGISRVARLASNENPWPPSPAAVQAGCAVLQGANRYPDESMAELTGTLTRFHGDYQFVTGVGMDGVIETTLRMLVDPGNTVAISVPTFSFYRLAALAQSAAVVEIPREPDFSISTRRFISQARDAKVSFLCSPNNPTGTATPPDDVREILSKIRGVLFLDNAYVEFSDCDYRPLMREFDNLVIGRTMSKAFALAGARVGYAFVPEWLLPFYARAATPFTLNSVSAGAASGALADRAAMEKYVSYVRQWRERFRAECPLSSPVSGANFVMFDTRPETGDGMVRRLAEKGVIVRSCASFPGLPDHYIRVSIGDVWENELFLSAVREICGSRS